MRFCKVTIDKVHTLWHASQAEQKKNIFFFHGLSKACWAPYSETRDTTEKLLLPQENKPESYAVYMSQGRLILLMDNKTVAERVWLMTPFTGNQMMTETACTVPSMGHVARLRVHCAAGEGYLRFGQCVRQRMAKAFLCPWIPRQSRHQLFKPHAERNHRMLSIGAPSQDS